MPIDVYLLRMSPGCRSVLMTAKHLNIDLNEKTVDLSEGQQFEPQFLKLNPAHCIPTIDDDGFSLWESRAILQYLCNQYAPDSSLYPKNPKKRAIVDRWLNFDVSLYRTQGLSMSQKWFFGVEPTEDQLNAYKDNLKLLDSLIGDNKYITGNDITIADLTLLATTSYLRLSESGIDLSEYPNLKRWMFSTSKELPYFEEINKLDKNEIKIFGDKMKAKMTEKKDK